MKNPLIFLEEERMPDSPDTIKKLMESFEISMTPDDTPIIIYKKTFVEEMRDGVAYPFHRDYVASPLKGKIQIYSPHICPVQFDPAIIHHGLNSMPLTDEQRRICERHSEALTMRLENFRYTIDFDYVNLFAYQNILFRPGLDPLKTCSCLSLDIYPIPHHDLETRIKYQQEGVNEKFKREDEDYQLQSKR